MKHRSVVSVLVLSAAILVLFSQCEFFVGEHEHGNLTIDTASLFGDSGDGRYIGIPPVGVISFTVTVSGPGMTTIEKTILPGTRYINMAVPNGLKRTIRLDANLDQAYMQLAGHEHLLSIAGESTVDILPGKIVFCLFHMGAGMTKPIIPDYGMGRVVRIPHMHPTTLATSDWATRTGVGSPRDIVVDSLGDIYVSNGSTTVYRIDQIPAVSTSTPITLPGLASPSPSITIDNANNRIYAYGNVGTLAPFYSIYYYTYIAPTGNGSLTPPTGVPTGTNQIAAIKYSNGVFYLAGNQSLPRIFRYVPGATPSTIEATSPKLINPVDILIKGPYVYVANYPTDPYVYSASDYATIEVFDKNSLAYIGSFGTRTDTTDDNTPGNFYGPLHFVATTNKKIYVVDDGFSSGQGRNRIIAFDDVETWAGWESFRAEQIPTNSEFAFYYFC